MINRTVLQVPMDKSLRQRAEMAASNLGFSSLQEIIRVLLTKLANKQLVVNIEETVIPLSAKAEKRYLRMDRDFKQGKNVFTAKDIDDLMRKLHEN